MATVASRLRHELADRAEHHNPTAPRKYMDSQVSRMPTRATMTTTSPAVNAATRASAAAATGRPAGFSSTTNPAAAANIRTGGNASGSSGDWAATAAMTATRL